MTNQRPLISVLCCAYNKKKYVDKSIPTIVNTLGISDEVFVVAERCTDKTVDITRRYDVKIIEKTWNIKKN